MSNVDQDAALAAAGFGPAFTPGGLFPLSLTYCLACGAAVPLLPIVEGQANPLELHIRWHGDTPPADNGA